MGLIPMSSAPNWEEALRAANGFGHNTYVDEGQWIGDPNMNQLGLGDSCYGMPGLGMGDDNVNQATQIINAIATPILQMQQQKLALKQQAIAAHQAKMQSQGSGGGMTQSSGLPPDIGKWLLYAGIAIVAGIIIMSLLKKKKGGGSGEHHSEHEHTVIDKEIGI